MVREMSDTLGGVFPFGLSLPGLLLGLSVLVIAESIYKIKTQKAPDCSKKTGCCFTQQPEKSN
jgi:hypothetical protein